MNKTKKYTLRYRRLTLRFDKNPRKGKCECCCKKCKTDLHHWKYEFETKEVKKNPELALKNVVEVCYYCHRVANAYKKILEEPIRIQRLSSTVPFEMLLNFEKETKKEWERINKPIKKC